MEEHPLPNLNTLDGLFILGGPINVYEDDKHPWLAREKGFLREAIETGKIVVGICLRAQLLSVVLGGSVTRNPHWEIGWFPVTLTPSDRDHALLRGFPDRFVAFHWHGDRFSIPPGAVHIARSEACEEQGFVYKARVVGLQFHLESTEESIDALLRHCGDEVTCAPYIQDSPSMQDQPALQRDTHALMDRLLDALTADRS